MEPRNCFMADSPLPKGLLEQAFFAAELTDGVETESTWTATELEEGQTEAEIHIVARDERGGQKVLGPYKIPIIAK